MQFGIVIETETKGIRRAGFSGTPFQALIAAQVRVRKGANLTSTLVQYFPHAEAMREIDLGRVLQAFCLKVVISGISWFTELAGEPYEAIANATNTFRDYLLGLDGMQTHPKTYRNMIECLAVWLDQFAWADLANGANGANPRYADIVQLFAVALDQQLETPARAALTAEVLAKLGMSEKGEQILLELIVAQYPELEGRLE